MDRRARGVQELTGCPRQTSPWHSSTTGGSSAAATGGAGRRHWAAGPRGWTLGRSQPTPTQPGAGADRCTGPLASVHCYCYINVCVTFNLHVDFQIWGSYLSQHISLSRVGLAVCLVVAALSRTRTPSRTSLFEHGGEGCNADQLLEEEESPFFRQGDRAKPNRASTVSGWTDQSKDGDKISVSETISTGREEERTWWNRDRDQCRDGSMLSLRT